MHSVTVTAGPTREYIDSVRYISNLSSGKQGYLIAKSFADAGHNVTLISGPTALQKPEGCKIVDVLSCSDMLNACRSSMPVDIAIFVAAVCDFRSSKVFEGKLPKANLFNSFQFELNKDIAAEISGSEERPKVTVCFSLEEGDNRDDSVCKSKMQKKGCDIMVSNKIFLNEGESVMSSDYNCVAVLSLKRPRIWLPLMKKSEIAAFLVNYIEDYIKIL